MISEASEKFGSQCIVLAIDAKRVGTKPDGKGLFHVFVHGGRIDTGIDAVKWAKEAQERGAGEILLTSMDADGTKEGFDLDLTAQVCAICSIPVIASGGAGKMEDFYNVFSVGADAGLAASLFHYRQMEILQLKQYLQSKGVPIRCRN